MKQAQLANHLLPVDPMAEAKLQWGDAPYPGTGKPCRVLGVKVAVWVEKLSDNLIDCTSLY
jgi:hypothetical protein